MLLAVARADPNFHAGGKGCPARSRTDGAGRPAQRKAPPNAMTAGPDKTAKSPRKKLPSGSATRQCRCRSCVPIQTNRSRRSPGTRATRLGWT